MSRTCLFNVNPLRTPKVVIGSAAHRIGIWADGTLTAQSDDASVHMVLEEGATINGTSTVTGEDFSIHAIPEILEAADRQGFPVDINTVPYEGPSGYRRMIEKSP